MQRNTVGGLGPENFLRPIFLQCKKILRILQYKADKNRSQCGNGAGRVLCNDKGKNPCSKPGDAETGGDDILGFVPLCVV